MTFFQEEILEPVARFFRFSKSISNINKGRPIVLLDIGCGPKIRFFFFAKKRGVMFKKYMGIDPLIHLKTLKSIQTQKNVVLYKQLFIKTFALESKSVDYVTAHAFIEHISVSKLRLIFNEALRVLKKDGKIIITTPTPKAKNILEFLAFRLKLLSRREIAEHKSYYDKVGLMNLLNKMPSGLIIRHEYFQMGLNNLLVVTKYK